MITIDNDTLRALSQRKSMRVFTDDPVAPEIKQAILHAAMQAPTAGNQMLYTILDITEPARKVQLAELCDHQNFIASAPVVLVFLADCRRWYEAFLCAGCAPRAPGPGDLLLAVSDAVIAAQNAVVAAESLGLGSCYIGDVLENCEQMRTLLTLPPWVVPAAMLVIGYPTQQQRQRKKPLRFDASYIVQENTYRSFSAAEHKTMHVAHLSGGARTTIDWEKELQAFCARKYNSDFSLEMSRSARVYLDDFLKKDAEDI